MAQANDGVVNWTTFGQTRALIGNEFVRILGYYRDDAAKNVVAIEQAFREGDAVAMVRPAHTLKGDSLQFGGESLGRLAEHIEHTARNCVEIQKSPAPPIDRNAVAIRARAEPGRGVAGKAASRRGIRTEGLMLYLF